MRFALLLVVLSAAVLVVPAASADIEILVSAPEGALEVEAGSSGSVSSAVQIRTTGDNLCFTQGPVSLSLAANATTPGVTATVVPATLKWEIPPGFHSSSTSTDWTGEAQTATITVHVSADAPRNLTSHVVLFEASYDGETPPNCQGTFEAHSSALEFTVTVSFPDEDAPSGTPGAPGAPGAGPTNEANGGIPGNGSTPGERPVESPALGIGLAIAVVAATLALLRSRR